MIPSDWMPESNFPALIEPLLLRSVETIAVGCPLYPDYPRIVPSLLDAGPLPRVTPCHEATARICHFLVQKFPAGLLIFCLGAPVSKDKRIRFRLCVPAALPADVEQPVPSVRGEQSGHINAAIK